MSRVHFNFRCLKTKTNNLNFDNQFEGLPGHISISIIKFGSNQIPSKFIVTIYPDIMSAISEAW